MDGFDIASAVEGLEVKLCSRSGFPEAEIIYGVGGIAGDGNIIRNSDEFLGSSPMGKRVSAIIENVFHMAIEFHFGGMFWANDFPRGAELHPFVGEFDLVTVAELLFKKPVLVVDAVADRGEVEGGKGVEKTSGEASESPVAECHIILLEAEDIDIVAEFLESELHFFKDARAVEAIGKKPSH